MVRRGKDEGDNLLQLLLSSEGAPQWKNEAQGLYHPLHLSTKTHYEIARPRRLTQMQEATSMELVVSVRQCSYQRPQQVRGTRHMTQLELLLLQFHHGVDTYKQSKQENNMREEVEVCC